MKRNFKNAKGITLIALVITIIVLLILAGVTIITLTGDNGILKKAGDAKIQTEQAKEDENLKIAIAGSYGTDGKLNLKDLKDNLTNQKISYTDSDKFPLEVTVNGEKKKIDANGNVTLIKLESVADSKTKGTVFNDVTTLEDTYGNQVKVPKGFKIASDSATDVTGGIVIEDATYTNTIGSQFVWIPVGTGANAIKKANKETVDIALGRYKFTKNSDGTIKTSEYSVSYKEDTTASHESDYKNAIAKDIEEFITSANSNHGYYIGRYEARTNVTRTTSTSDDKLTQLMERPDAYVYNWVTQPQAAKLSREMYTDNKFKSDLVNSYAWDTTIVFAQTFDNRLDKTNQYSKQTSLNLSNFLNTGTNNLELKDLICNIFDMASNDWEWTTETSLSKELSCVARGRGIS